MNNRFRKPKTFFTQVSNHAIDDHRLSPQAYYIYSKIQRYITLENFVLNKEFLFSKCNMSADTFDKYWKELQHAGYLKMYQMPCAKDNANNPHVAGKKKVSFTWITEYELLEQADLSTPYYMQYNRNGAITKSYDCKDVASKQRSSVKQYSKPAKTVRQMVAEAQSDAEGVNLQGTLKYSDAKVPPLNNTNLNNTLTNNNKSSSSEEEDLLEVIELFKKCINVKLSTKQKETLKELLATHGKDKVLTAIEVTGETATAPNIKYLRKVCDSKSNPISVKVTTTKVSSFNNLGSNSHNWDLEELEERATQYMENTLYSDHIKLEDTL